MSFIDITGNKGLVLLIPIPYFLWYQEYLSFISCDINGTSQSVIKTQTFQMTITWRFQLNLVSFHTVVLEKTIEVYKQEENRDNHDCHGGCYLGYVGFSNWHKTQTFEEPSNGH
jgi:hypothetical protein